MRSYVLKAHLLSMCRRAHGCRCCSWAKRCCKCGFSSTEQRLHLPVLVCCCVVWVEPRVEVVPFVVVVVERCCVVVVVVFRALVVCEAVLVVGALVVVAFAVVFGADVVAANVMRHEMTSKHSLTPLRNLSQSSRAAEVLQRLEPDTHRVHAAHVLNLTRTITFSFAQKGQQTSGRRQRT